MKKSLTLGALVLVALGGCESLRAPRTSTPQGAEVTRTHLGQPIARGEIRVEPSIPVLAGTAEFGQVEAAVHRELARLGWTVLPSKTTTEQVAVVRMVQTPRPDSRMLYELGVRIQRRSDATVAWEGVARAEGRAIAAPMEAAAAFVPLAEALFRDFPGESGRTIRVR